MTTLPFGNCARTRMVRHSARSRYQLLWRFQPCSWSRMMTSSRSRTATCADAGAAAASVAATATPKTTDSIRPPLPPPGPRRTRDAEKCFDLYLRRRVRYRLETHDRQPVARSSAGEAHPGTDLSAEVEQAASLGQDRTPLRSGPEDPQ